jgi:hypothetical protein
MGHLLLVLLVLLLLGGEEPGQGSKAPAEGPVVFLRCRTSESCTSCVCLCCGCMCNVSSSIWLLPSFFAAPLLVHTHSHAFHPIHDPHYTKQNDMTRELLPPAWVAVLQPPHGLLEGKRRCSISVNLPTLASPHRPPIPPPKSTETRRGLAMCVVVRQSRRCHPIQQLD